MSEKKVSSATDFVSLFLRSSTDFTINDRGWSPGKSIVRFETNTIFFLNPFACIICLMKDRIVSRRRHEANDDDFEESTVAWFGSDVGDN